MDEHLKRTYKKPINITYTRFKENDALWFIQKENRIEMASK